MSRRPWFPVVLLAAGAACAAKGPPFLQPALTTTTPPGTAAGAAASGPGASTAPPRVPGNVTLLVTGLRLVNSEESDNAFRALLDSPAADVTVKLTGIPTPNQVVLVCPVDALDKHTAPADACVMPASGAQTKVPHGPANRGVEIVQVGVTGPGPSGSSTAISEISISYAATSRHVQFRLPAMQQGEGGSQPLFRMTPAGSGAYSATALFTSSIGSPAEAELTLVSGTANQNLARGPGPSLSGNLSPPVEAGFRLRNSGSIPLTALTLDAQFP